MTATVTLTVSITIHTVIIHIIACASERHSLHSVELGMRIIVRTAGGSHCEVLPSSSWTCHDLHMDIQTKLGIPVSQQRLLHGSKLLEKCMAAAGVEQ